MKILIAHNFYLEGGGEDIVYRDEAALLSEHGHNVFRLERDNRDVAELGVAALAASAIWSRKSYREVRDIVAREKIDVVHFHNTLPLISPSGYYGAHAAGAAVVQTLHNYRLNCVNALLFRAGAPCEDCVGRSLPWRGVLHRCYRDSYAASAGVGAMLSFHRLRGTWKKQVDRYIALTEFAKQKFMADGIPENLISVKPNFGGDIAISNVPGRKRGGFLYVGRVSQEKGILPLLAASTQVKAQFRVIGDGPLKLPPIPPNVLHMGAQPKDAVMENMVSSLALVLPSLCYEGFPMVVAEAFAAGLPVIASRIGGIPEIVEDGVTGLLFTPGEEADLVKTLNWATEHSEAMAEMGQNARRRYEERFVPRHNYTRLMEIYDEAIAHRHRG